MISLVPENPPQDGTQHVPDGPAPSTETQFVPDGTLIASPKPIGSGVRPPKQPSQKSGDQTQHVDDLPRFGRFRALAELGSGAMGTVYRAQDEVLGRSVAIKALHARDTGTRERFLREARAIGAVLHPNILAVYDAGTDDNTPYLVMELAAGGSLRERIQAGPLPIETVREVGIQISRALAAAHAANIIHRDVKPANILAAGDVWKLADFGIARLPDSTLTVEGQFLGSPSYAAPESLRTGQFSPASDVYGLGATLYEALTGAPPHGDHDMQSVVRKLEQDAPPVHARRAVPGPLNDALMATLSRDPAKRPSADELAQLLANTDGDHVPVRTAPSTRSKVIALVLAAVAVVLVIIALQRDKSGSAASPLPSLDPREKMAKPRAVDPSPADPREDEREDERKDERNHFAEPPTAPEPPSAPEPPAAPTIVDQYGNPVDEETAKKILEQMQRDAEEEFEHLHGKRKKRRHR
ncbi:MAG TPA: serine/threonine-protein kinase [Kofleriaceae bacterium]